MASTRLLLVRHGETDWNATGRIQGHSDTPLNEAGRLQARRAARRLAREPIRAVYSSDLARAYETAMIIGAPLGLTAVPSPRLRERQYGAWEGLTGAEIQARYPREFAAWRARSTDFAPPQGETRSQLLTRALAELQVIGRRHQEQMVVVVTHGGLCNVFINYALGNADGEQREFSFGNASIHTLDVTDGQWSVVTMNEVAHLLDVECRAPDGKGCRASSV